MNPGDGQPMHVIRLRKPWEKLDPRGPQRQRVDVPEPESGEQPGSVESPVSGTSPVAYQRRFNRPTGLTAGAPVLLRISGWSGELTSLSLNDQPVPTGPAPLEVDVADLLQPHNRLELTLAAGADGTAPRLSGEVSLAIAK